jgi:hypothetical protein
MTPPSISKMHKEIDDVELNLMRNCEQPAIGTDINVQVMDCSKKKEFYNYTNVSGMLLSQLLPCHLKSSSGAQ